MTWFKVDDNLAFHRKTVAAGNPAMGLWVRAGSWCAQHLTDGFIPDHMIATLGTPAQRKRLVSAGLWTEAEGGCRFYGWSKPGRQPSSESVIAKRERNAERQAKHRSAPYKPATSSAEENHLASATTIHNARTADGIFPASDAESSESSQVSAPSNAVSHALVTGAVTGGVTAPPTRPDPTRPEELRTLAPLAEPDRFADFYAAYPRRQDRRAAERAWKAALKRGADPDQVITAAQRYARLQIGQERRYIKLPATWLNAASYDDEPEPTTGPLRLVAGGSTAPAVALGTSSQRANAFLALRQGDQT